MEKKKSNIAFYLFLGVVMLIITLLFAGNLAYYRFKDFGTALNLAMSDLFTFKLHISFEPEYMSYYGKAILIYIFCAIAFYVEEERNRHDAPGKEAGSAEWNTKLADYNKKYTDPIGSPKCDGPMNMILSSTVRLSIEDRETRRNNNIIIIGGAGTGKSRFFIKPNILQLNCSFVATDPSGELLASLGKELESQGFKLKVFNLVNMAYSDYYNPFQYIRNDEGVGILVDCFMSNTTPPDQSSSDPFWESATCSQVVTSLRMDAI